MATAESTVKASGLGRFAAQLAAENAAKLLDAASKQPGHPWWKRAALRIAAQLLRELAEELRTDEQRFLDSLNVPPRELYDIPAQ